MRYLFVMLIAGICWLALSVSPGVSQGYQCRTSPVGAVTSYCASEAFVTRSVGFTGAASSQTGNISITSTNNLCGMFVLASGGQNTITLSPPSGFPSNCIITIKDDEVYSGSGTGRGKLLSGFPSDLFATLYPGQVLAIGLDATGTNWKTIFNPGRWKIPTSGELCVVQNGNDAHDGLGTGAAADCMASLQTALVVIGEQWDGGGYFACAIGLYAGGTSTFGAASQTGQSIGCYITVNIRGAITWTASGACWTGGDNSITIINWNLGFVPTFKCNTANTASTGQLKCHQYCVFDINGGTAIWLPGGSNDVFFDVDLQGSATYNATVNVGDGVNTYTPLAFMACEAHCSKITVSGSLASSPFVTFNQAFILHSGSVITTGITWPGVTATNTTAPTGLSNLITNGTTIPGGTTPAAPVSGCAQGTGATGFGIVCLTTL